MKSHKCSPTVQAPPWNQLRAVCLCARCARLSLNLLIYSPDFLSAHSYPHAPVLFFRLFALLLSCHWRSVKTAVKRCLCSPWKSAILCGFLLLKALPSSADPRVLPVRCCPVNLPSLSTAGHDAQHNSVTTSIRPLEVLFRAPGSFRFSGVTVMCCLTPRTTNFCVSSVTSYLRIIQFMLTFLFSSLFRVSLKLGSSAGFISTFLTLHAMVLMRIPGKIPNTQHWRAPWVIPFSWRISFSHNMFPFIQVNTLCTFQILYKFLFFPVKSHFPCGPVWLTVLKSKCIHCMSSRKFLAKKPDEMNICLRQIPELYSILVTIYTCVFNYSFLQLLF